MMIKFPESVESKLGIFDKEIIKLMIYGKSQVCISDTFSCSERKVREHVINMKIDFNANNIPQLIYYISTGNFNAA